LGGIGAAWTMLFLEPMLNCLVLLYSFLFHNFGLTIIVFTVIVRLLILPLTLKQLRASKAMSTLQPKLQELQKKYAKDREKLSKETMALYKEHGVNPLGCAIPTFIQMPVWIGLYQSILLAMASRPENMLALSRHLYPNLPIVNQVIPLSNSFLWLNLATPDKTFILPILVAGSMWVQQKMMTVPSVDSQQAQMNRMMQTMMPLMFGFFTLNVASGLALYWLVSNLISIVFQYFVTGWGSLIPSAATQTPARLKKGEVEKLKTQPAAVSAQAKPRKKTEEEKPRSQLTANQAPAKLRKRTEDENPRSQRKERQRGYRAGPDQTRGQTERGASNGPH